MSFRAEAIARVEGYLENYDTDSVAEILADIMHYVEAKGIDLNDMLYTAEGYVQEEVSVDEEMNDA